MTKKFASRIKRSAVLSSGERPQSWGVLILYGSVQEFRTSSRLPKIAVHRGQKLLLGKLGEMQTRKKELKEQKFEE